MNYVCPLCRGTYDDTFRFWTLRRQPGQLRCSNPVCEGRFITQPFPIILPNPASALVRMIDVPKGVTIPALGMLLQHITEDNPLFDILDTRSRHLWSQFYDLMPQTYCPPWMPEAPFVIRALSLLDQVELSPGTRALIAGSGPGRGALELAERLKSLGRPPLPGTSKVSKAPLSAHSSSGPRLARTSPEVHALEQDPVLLQAFREMTRAKKLSIILRASVERWHTPETMELPRALSAAANIIHPVCSDILEPPFEAESFDLVVCLDMLDKVPDPIRLLGQLQAMTRPGGFLLLASAFNWRPEITPRNKRLSSVVPHARLSDTNLLQQILTGQISCGITFNMLPLALMEEPIPAPIRIHDTHMAMHRSHISLWKK